MVFYGHEFNMLMSYIITKADKTNSIGVTLIIIFMFYLYERFIFYVIKKHFIQLLLRSIVKKSKTYEVLIRNNSCIFQPDVTATCMKALFTAI